MVFLSGLKLENHSKGTEDFTSINVHLRRGVDLTNESSHPVGARAADEGAD